MNNIKEKSLVYNNLRSIYDKTKIDKNINLIFKSVNKIFDKEINYAILQISKLEILNNSIDFEDILTKNIFVFKENLKLLFSSSSNITSRNYLGNISKDKTK